MDELPFGRLVRERRRALDLTQEELARRVACAAITVRKIEAGALRPSLQVAERLAQALAIPLDDRAAFTRTARRLSADGAEPPATPPSPVLVPEEIGIADLSGHSIRGYQLGERLGSGGFGAVYRAVQPLVERDVAVKIILPRFADQPEFIRRFEAEAQLVARLEHPHIVPLYDYWREPGVAYLVMRLLRGGTLHALLQQGPLALERVVTVVEQIGNALQAAHRAGVIHRDLKPANVLLDEEGNAYLADFGIAKDLHRPAEASFAGAFVGSPAYSSPEQIRAELVTPQTDIYALGLLLYELLTGQKPFPGPTPASFLEQHLNASVPSLATYRPGLPSALDRAVRRATAKVPTARYGNVAELLTELRAALAVAMAPVTPHGEPIAVAAPPTQILDLTDADNPYQGLRPFAEANAANFFGREALVQQLLGRLGEGGELERFLAVVGPSGSGKSSAVRAGLIPALRAGGLPGSEQWYIVDLLPGAHPLRELAATLMRVAPAGVEPDDVHTLLRADNLGLLRAARLVLPPDRGELLLVLDQFEELFTLTADEAERAHLLDSLVAAVLDERSRLRIVVTLRADFIGRPLQYVDFGELLRQRVELVLPLTADELERAIVEPARWAGLALDDGLAATLVADVANQPGVLPLLQHSLSELFTRRQGRLLTRAAYQKIGGVSGGLANSAERLVGGLDTVHQALLRQIFLRLTTPGEDAADTRRRTPLAELQSLGEGADRVIATFGAARFLTFDHDPLNRAPTVEVAHEALLREWPRLRGWLDATRTDLRLQRRLAQEAAEWEQAGRADDYLASGARLGQYEALAQGEAITLTQGERSYLVAALARRDRKAIDERERQARELAQTRALAEEQRRRVDEQSRAAAQLRRRAVLLASVLVLALVAAAIAGAFANDNAALARTNAASAATAQAASDQARAGRATAVAEAQLRATQQAIAETNFTNAQRQRLALEANDVLNQTRNGELAALLALHSLRIAYTPQADGALLRAQEHGLPRRTFSGHTDSVNSVAFSPDGRTALTASWDGTARLWDVATGKELRQLTDPTAPSAMYDAVFASDGKMVLTGSEDGIARLWDVATGGELRRFTGHTNGVTGVAVSPDGRLILTCGADAIARLWDATTGQELRQFTGHAPGLCHVIFSPDGRSALTTSDSRYAPTTSTDTTARLWDVATGQVLRTFAGHTDGLTRAVFSPDGRLVLTDSRDKTARLWDAATGQEVRLFQDTEWGKGVAFSPDGEYVVTANGIARLWDARSGQELRQFVGANGGMVVVAISPDGNYALTAGDDLPRLWDLRATPGSRVLAGSTNDLAFAAISPDGRHALTRSNDKAARLWDVVTGQELRVFTAPDQIRSVTLSPDGKLVLAGCSDKIARLWDAQTGQELRLFTGHSDQVTGVAFSPDGKLILTGSFDKTARLWDAQTGQHVRTFAGHTDWVISVAFSPDGKSVLTSSYDDTVRLWDVATGKELHQFSGLGGGATDAVFSSDGTSVLTASGDGTARLWDSVTGHELRRFIGHRAAVGIAIFSPNGQYVATSSADRTVRLWDRATGQELRQFIGHTLEVWGLAFTPDGKQILSSSRDGTTRLWHVDLQDVIQLACAQLGRDLTDEERKQYDIPNDGPTCSPG